MMKPNYVRVIIDRAIQREFDYSVPETLADRIDIGSRVRVPFETSPPSPRFLPRWSKATRKAFGQLKHWSAKLRQSVNRFSSWRNG